MPAPRRSPVGRGRYRAGVKALDRLLQNWRIDQARPYIPPGAHVLDVGTADGALFTRLGDRIGSGVGIDPDVASRTDGRFRYLHGRFPEDLDTAEEFDVVTALAFFEHVQDDERDAIADACFAALAPGGHCILTIPSPAVDHILTVLVGLHVIDGMHEGEHHGFDVRRTPDIFENAGFKLLTRGRFQLALNNLFVFEKLES